MQEEIIYAGDMDRLRNYVICLPIRKNILDVHLTIEPAKVFIDAVGLVDGAVVHYLGNENDLERVRKELRSLY